MMNKNQIRTIVSSFFILGFVYPVWSAYSILIPYIQEDRMWSRGTVSAGLAVLILVHGISSAGAGYFCDRFSTRRVIRIGGILVGIGLCGASLSSSPLQLFLAYGFIGGFGIAMSGWIPTITAITHRTAHSISTSAGIASMGSGAGLLIAAPLLQIAILKWGWENALIMQAIVAFLGVQFAVSFMPMKLLYPKKIENLSVGHIGAQNNVKELFNVLPFWQVFIAFFGFNFGLHLLQTHQVAYLLDNAWSPLVAASVVALLGILTIPFRTILGVCSDHFGREPTYSVGAISLICAVGILTLIVARTCWIIGPYLYVFLLSIASSTVAPLNSAIVADLFGMSRYGSIYGFLMIGAGLGAAFGVYGGGFVFDQTGNYDIAFLLVVAFALIAMMAIWISYPRRGFFTGS